MRSGFRVLNFILDSIIKIPSPSPIYSRMNNLDFGLYITYGYFVQRFSSGGRRIKARVKADAVYSFKSLQGWDGYLQHRGLMRAHSVWVDFVKTRI